MTEFQPIRTEYKGYLFRSRLEARWAVFFDALGVKWEYEPEGYDLGDGLLYLPDFLLHGVTVNHAYKQINRDIYVEVKGRMTDLDGLKIRRFYESGYRLEDNPKIAAEVLLGHRRCNIILESSVLIPMKSIYDIVKRIAGDYEVDCREYAQDEHLEKNQTEGFRCGDNGIFRGVPITQEQVELSGIARTIYYLCPGDGKYVLDADRLIICQSNVSSESLKRLYPDAEVNPIGEWTGGTDVDSGAVNRKLGSDMGDSATGGGIHGKDLSKADVSVNIYAWLKAQETGRTVELSCAVGDETVDGRPYKEVVDIAREFIREKGGFEKFAEWGLI